MSTFAFYIFCVSLLQTFSLVSPNQPCFFDAVGALSTVEHDGNDKETQDTKTAPTRAKNKKPHILFILADDIGWNDVGFNKKNKKNRSSSNILDPSEVQTPVMDKLVNEGIHLQRHYVHMTCTGTRVALQSGRLPVHVQTSLKNPEEPSAGMPRNMTGVAQILQTKLGYRTHYVGKWDVGMATSKHIPLGRGYETSLGYFEHKNDYWTQECAQSDCCPLLGNNTNNKKDNRQLQVPTIYDLWDTNHPARDLVGTNYEEFIFLDRMLKIIDNHNNLTEPLFLFYAPHIAHCPLQVPPEYLSKFDFIQDDTDLCKVQTDNVFSFDKVQPYPMSCRKQYHAMVNLLDDMIGRVVERFRQRNMYDDLLIVFTSDNGGPVRLIESAGSNYPLRGGKYSPWEGGVRAAAFVSGGFLPVERRGIALTEPLHICDWYRTLPAFAASDKEIHDELAARSNLPAIDAINMAPLLLGQVAESPRKEIPLSKQALIVGDYKLLWNDTIPWAGWSDQCYPHKNSSWTNNIQNMTLNCSTGCLFDVANDVSELYDLANEQADRVEEMKKRLIKLRESFFENNDKGVDSCPPGISMPCACWMAINYYGGFFGPYQELGSFESIPRIAALK